MCGIGLLLTLPNAGDQMSSDSISELNQELSKGLSSRGPDVPCGMQCQNMRSGHDNIQDLTLHASVLHMQGTLPTPQPLLFNNDCVLCWNGECYSYHDTQKQNMVEMTGTENTEVSDTGLVANMLQDALNNCNESRNHHNAIADVMSRIHGEYAFIIFVPSTSDNSPSYIYFGRDPLGRRSLLINKSIHGGVLLSSVSISTNSCTLTAKDDGNLNAQEWVEISPGSVHRMDIETGTIETKEFSQIINRAITRIIESSKESTDATDFMQLLDKAVELRVAHVPSSHCNSDGASVAILFSGGIDSVVLAALSHRHVPKHQPIDLINVSFFSDSNGNNSTNSPDRQAAILSYVEMQSLFPERIWRFIAVDVKYDEVLHHEDHIRRLLHPLQSTMDFNIATAFWFSARSEGRLLDSMEIEEVQTELKASEDSINIHSKEFSSQEPLLRFASKSDRSNSTATRNTQLCIREGCSRRAQPGCIFQSCKFCCGKFQGPISSFLGQSARICPTHNHKQCTKGNGSESKTSKAKNGKKKIAQQLEKNAFTSSAKVLISGVGADEQLAGYGRHRTTFQRGGYEALAGELEMEVNRLWKRNLGRDDRCLSDHGKEARFPFLDDSVVHYLAKLPVHRKCDMTQAPGVGDKRLLREVARMVGVHSCSTLVKRAIQFGSRIAKVSDRSRFGSCRQASGTAAIRNAKK